MKSQKKMRKISHHTKKSNMRKMKKSPMMVSPLITLGQYTSEHSSIDLQQYLRNRDNIPSDPSDAVDDDEDEELDQKEEDDEGEEKKKDGDEPAKLNKRERMQEKKEEKNKEKQSNEEKQ